MSLFNPLGYCLVDWSGPRAVFDAIVFTLIIAVSYVVIWFYSQGRNWARLAVLLTSAIAVLNLTYWSAYGVLARAMIGGEAMLAVFLLFWLNTAEVRELFREASNRRSNSPEM